MRISDWSSDVCSSDLLFAGVGEHVADLVKFTTAVSERLQQPGLAPLGFVQLAFDAASVATKIGRCPGEVAVIFADVGADDLGREHADLDRKSTRLNSSH